MPRKLREYAEVQSENIGDGIETTPPNVLVFAATPEQVQNLINETRGSGAHLVSADTKYSVFTISSFGTIADAEYDGETLTVVVTKKPIFNTYASIVEGIMEAMGEVK